MTCDISARSPAASLYRIGRKPDPWAWPDWSLAGKDGTFGNRWDDPAGQYRVLYTSSQKLGALVEVLARFRPDPAVVRGCAEVDGEFDSLPAGRIPKTWIDGRLVGEATVSGSFAEVGEARSLSFLRGHFPDRLVHYGLDDLDAGTIRLSTPRRFTQEISRFIYECSMDDGVPQFLGIYYRSRIGDKFENWAIFERAREQSVLQPSSRRIEPTDPDLLEALALLKLEFAE